LCGQFAGDRGKKEASKEEEKRKEKEALRVEREKELKINVSMKKKFKTTARSYKARANRTCSSGKIDLNPKTKLLLL
jgi:translation initiation factor IF-2